MPHIAKSELPDILTVANGIAVHCVSENVIDTTRDFATTSPFATTRVKIRPGRGRFNDLACYEADSAISVTIPNTGRGELRVAGKSAPASVIALIASALAHELTHARQKAADRTSFGILVTEQKAFDKDAAQCPQCWFDGYYHAREELEAHATQVAVELWALALLAGTTLVPATADMMATETARRLCERMGEPESTGDARIDQWWHDLRALASTDISAFA